MKALTEKMLVTIAAISAACAAGNGSTFGAKADLKPLEERGLVETNETMTNEAGEIAVRMTEAGQKYVAENAPEGSAETVAGPASFTIEKIAKPVDPRGSSGRPDMYPFEELEAPDADGNVSSFFVPNSPDRPDAKKSLSSTVSGASKRHATITGTKEVQNADGTTKTRNVYEYAKKFKVVSGERDGVKGAIVFREK